MKSVLKYVALPIGVFLLGILIWYLKGIDLTGAFQISSEEAGKGQSEDLVELRWDDLQKLDYKQGIAPKELTDKLAQSDIKIPGFIVPLDDDVRETHVFLFVPNRQACIHVPPPPPNLMIHVKSEKQVNVTELFGPVWLEGDLQIETADSKFGSAAWSMLATKVYPYQ